MEKNDIYGWFDLKKHNVILMGKDRIANEDRMKLFYRHVAEMPYELSD